MIAYFDTSAVLPLIIDEPSTELCNRLWSTCTRVVSSRLLYPEARAALSRAQRMDRISTSQLNAAVVELDSIMTEIDHIELTDDLAHASGELAQAHGLRGCDAVHLGAAIATRDDALVVVTGDALLADAATAVGLATSLTVT